MFLDSKREDKDSELRGSKLPSNTFPDLFWKGPLEAHFKSNSEIYNLVFLLITFHTLYSILQNSANSKRALWVKHKIFSFNLAISKDIVMMPRSLYCGRIWTALHLCNETLLNVRTRNSFSFATASSGSVRNNTVPRDISPT